MNIFEKEFSLRTGDFTCNHSLLPSAILDLFQTVAGEHANILGCGFNDLIKKGLIWVIVKTKYEVITQPPLFSRVRVKTWPLPPSRISFQREYLIEDESGNPLVKGTSDWVVVDSVSRKLASAKEVYPDMEFCAEKMFEGRAPKIQDFGATENPYVIIPRFSQLDMNNHVNNTKYLNFALDSADISSNEEISSAQIEFRHEVLADTELNVYSTRIENEIICKGEDKDKQTMFACKFTLK